MVDLLSQFRSRRLKPDGKTSDDGLEQTVDTTASTPSGRQSFQTRTMTHAVLLFCFVEETLHAFDNLLALRLPSVNQISACIRCRSHETREHPESTGFRGCGDQRQKILEVVDFGNRGRQRHTHGACIHADDIQGLCQTNGGAITKTCCLKRDCAPAHW